MEVTDKQIRKIMELTADLDVYGAVWGNFRENFGSFKKYAKKVRRILQ